MMFAICIESSHVRGMGHLFRALNFITYLQEKKEPYILLINRDECSLAILEKENIPFEIVDFAGLTENWEAKIIEKYQVNVWLNDKFESSFALCRHVKDTGVFLAVIDDRGAGAALADLHFAGMMFRAEGIPGKVVHCGLDYNILNPEIKKYRRLRTKAEKLIVTLGGSDTYGVTVSVVKRLAGLGYRADIVLGPNFRHEKELEPMLQDGFRVFHTVPSLVEAFSRYDVAVTGGGVTCLEAGAAGLPCVIIANEPHEVETGKYMESLGCAAFAGYYKQLREDAFFLEKLDIPEMSSRGLENIPLTGCANIYKKIMLAYGGK